LTPNAGLRSINLWSTAKDRIEDSRRDLPEQQKVTDGKVDPKRSVSAAGAIRTDFGHELSFVILSPRLFSGPCCDLQGIRFSTAHDQPVDAPDLPRKGGPRPGQGSRLSGISLPAWKSTLPSQADSSSNPTAVDRSFRTPEIGKLRQKTVAKNHV
jgi:hypothetical protein